MSSNNGNATTDALLTGFVCDADGVYPDGDPRLCPVCMGPAVPHTVLNCGHALCGECAGKVVECPTDRSPITTRIHYHQMTQLILEALRYRCVKPKHLGRECTFVGSAAEARAHDECDLVPLPPQPDPPAPAVAATATPVRWPGSGRVKVLYVDHSGSTAAVSYN